MRLHAQVPEYDRRPVACVADAPNDGGTTGLDGLARRTPCVEGLVRAQLVQHHQLARLTARVLLVRRRDLVATIPFQSQLLRALAAEDLLYLLGKLVVALGFVDRRFPRLLGLREVLRGAQYQRYAENVQEEQREDHGEIRLAILPSNQNKRHAEAKMPVAVKLAHDLERVYQQPFLPWERRKPEYVRREVSHVIAECGVGRQFTQRWRPYPRLGLAHSHPDTTLNFDRIEDRLDFGFCSAGCCCSMPST